MPPPIPRPGGRAHRLTRSPLIHTLLQGMYVHILGCLGVASFTFLAYALAAAVRPAPWWNPQYSIPTLGLMLGNAVTGVAVGLGTLLDELGRGSGGDGVELMLCLGASRWEASRGAVARAAKLAMTPILNQLSVVGLVWIPGMMTGQMIAGADPAQVCVCVMEGGRGKGAAAAAAKMALLNPTLKPLPPHPSLIHAGRPLPDGRHVHRVRHHRLRRGGVRVPGGGHPGGRPGPAAAGPADRAEAGWRSSLAGVGACGAGVGGAEAGKGGPAGCRGCAATKGMTDTHARRQKERERAAVRCGRASFFVCSFSCK